MVPDTRICNCKLGTFHCGTALLVGCLLRCRHRHCNPAGHRQLRAHDQHRRPPRPSPTAVPTADAVPVTHGATHRGRAPHPRCRPPRPRASPTPPTALTRASHARVKVLSDLNLNLNEGALRLQSITFKMIIKKTHHEHKRSCTAMVKTSFSQPRGRGSIHAKALFLIFGPTSTRAQWVPHE